jgi:heparan-alpha-glucosaminide N-acetyltransferase
MAEGSGKRVESIDVLRGITILVMIFVNDLAGVAGAPAWMKHFSPPDADGMTFVDVVFPAFLFIVGLSIPFSIGARLRRGEGLALVWRHILVRTVALLVIGVFMVNDESIGVDGVLSPPVWTLLMYIGVILTWNVGSKQPRSRERGVPWLRLAGVAVLVAAALLYRGTGERSIIELRPQWWGILGLIGWAYLVSCLFYIPLRRQMAGVLGVTALLYCVFLADQAGLFASWTVVTQWVSIGSMLGSHSAITLSGVVLGMALEPDSPIIGHASRIRWGLVYGGCLALAGVLLHSLNGIHRMFIINKIAATPPWCLLSSAWTVCVWVGVYWLMDVRGWRRWAVPVAPAGSNALFAYVLAPILGALFSLVAIPLGFNFYGMVGKSFAIGFWRSVVFAFAVTWLAGGLRRLGIWLRL